MRKTILKLSLSFLLAFAFEAGAEAKSLVLTLDDGTQVYYLVSNDNPPRMVLADDGTFTLNNQDYTIANVKCFAYSSTDYSGEKGTVDGIVEMDDTRLTMKGNVRIYTLDGRLVSEGGSLASLKAGIYVLTDGTTTLKIQKRP
ncbi:MAG: hypothetical protein LUC33_01830 [Prevotellaceae bacterium]|nr:hypothetical protein [Prevotellaceae bacterium]